MPRWTWPGPPRNSCPTTQMKQPVFSAPPVPGSRPTILGPLIIGIITGSVVIENIFGIPGLGKEFITSILARDYNIVIGVFTFYAALVGLANLTVDVIYPVLDPRIRY